MNEKNKPINEKRPVFGVFLARALILQAITVAIIIIALLIIKSFWAKGFESIKSIYDQSFTLETRVEDVMGDEKT